ncbi:MATE family efflux transporter [Achromobacter spanius]|uniref:MATE family efflux transporter n=1 Tax=Achromobacter spanius TaxID=217203 RepID=UPI003AF0FD90
MAGYGAAARLEFLLVPLSFGIGGPAAILIGTNAAAGRIDRARRATLIAACLGFGVAEAIGLVVAIWPELWLD